MRSSILSIFDKKNTGALSLGVLCFQGFGIRIFEHAIIIWLILLCIINYSYLIKSPQSYWLKFIFFIFFSLIFSFLKGTFFPIYIYVAWGSSAVVLSRYLCKKNSFIVDLKRLALFCMYYNLMHIPIMYLLKGFLIQTSLSMNPYTFLYLFWFNHEETIFGGYRIQGFCWEPSCWNLLLNINLIFALFYSSSKKYIGLSIICIVAIMSTTGLIVMSAIILMYFLFNIKKISFNLILLIGLFFLILLPFVFNEYNQKTMVGSGQQRLGDFAILYAVMNKSPLLGEGLDNITTLSYAMNARASVWTVENGNFDGFMEQGMTNAFASLFIEWGIPFTILLLLFMYRSPLFVERKIRYTFVSAFLLILMGTPISRTGFFYLFPLSFILLKQKKSYKI